MKYMKNLRIVLTGGGSGGHIYPLLAVADAVRRIAKNEGRQIDLIYMGPYNEQYEELFKNRDIPAKFILSAKFRRYFSISNFIDIPKFCVAFLQALSKLFWIMPEAVFSKGGPGALPVVIAAAFYRIPIVIHEADVIPGLTTIFSARFARRIGVSFAATTEYLKLPNTFLSGNPVRDELLTDVPSKESAKADLGFDPSRPLLFVVGGSQGARALNEFIIVNLTEIVKVVNVLHQTGVAEYSEVQKLAETALGGSDIARKLPLVYRAVPFLKEDMKTALAAADVVLSRAGSSAIFEFAAFGKPAILIPLPNSASGHQARNASEFAEAGAGKVIDQNNLLPHIFLNSLVKILDDPELYAKMSSAARSFFKPDAAERIARELLGVIDRGV